MKIKKFIHILLLTFLITSCSKEAGKTGATFKLKLSSFASLGVGGSGGAMIWGRSDKGDMFGSVIDGSDKQIALANGSWNFWAVAWEGDGGSVYAFRGKARCAKSSALLNGADVNVSLSLSNTTCAAADFSPVVTLDGADNKFPEILHYDCNKVTDHNGYACGKNNEAAKAVSKRIIFHPFVKPAGGGFNIQGGGLVSECVSVGNKFMNTFIPVGNGSAPFFTDVQSFFSDASCDENDPKGFFKDYYEFGLLGSQKPNKIATVNNGVCNAFTFTQANCIEMGGAYSANCTSIPTSKLQQITDAGCVARGGVVNADTTKRLIVVTAIPDEVLCSGVRIDPNSVTPNSFASGDGSDLAPYTICKEYQLNRIGAGYMTDNFQINADLDMNKTSILKAVLGSTQPVPECTGKDISGNFIPIGGVYGTAPTCIPYASSMFYGLVNGNDHVISNIRLRAEDVDDLGFIRQGGHVKNLTFKNIQIEGKDNVGAVVGKDAYSFENVKIVKADITGKNNVGGVAGRYGDTSFGMNRVEASEMEVRARDMSSAAGGLIGMGPASGSTINIKNSFFKGKLTSHGSSASLGGLIGDAFNSDANITTSYTNGVVLVNTDGAFNAGGLIGKASSNVNIAKSYSQMDIVSATNSGTSGSGVMAGLIASSATPATIDKSFYIGSIMGQCNKASSVYCTNYTISPNSTNTTAAYGALLYPGWSNAVATDHTALGSIGSGLTSIASGSGGLLYTVANSPGLKLNWDVSQCASTLNNASVTAQAAAGRGQTQLNPVILCNRNQWLEIQANQTLHYALEDNLSLGEISLSDMPASFSGTINGRGHIISGFRAYVTTGNGGLFKSLVSPGKVSHVKFLGNVIESVGTASAVGTFGTSFGVIENNDFDGFFLTGNAQSKGVVAGVNSGVILLNNVEGKVMVSGSANAVAGLAVGNNASTGEIRGLRTEGELQVTGSLGYFVGGIVGTNNGVMSEISSNTRILSSNSDSASRFGGIAGLNSFKVTDAIAEPRAQIFLSTEAPMAGQVFGEVLSTSIAKRVLAYNEQVLTSPTMESTLKHFVGVHNVGATYPKSFGLQGSVFEPDTSLTLNFDYCTVNGQGWDYEVTSGFANNTYASGYFINSSFSGDGLTKRIVGSHTTATSTISSPNAGDFKVHCDDMNNTMTLQRIKSSTDFNATGFSSVNMGGASYFNNYCASGAGQTGNYVFKCTDPEDFDIVEDKPNGIGMNRLIQAYAVKELSGSLPASYPVWKLEPDSYPRLFLAD